MSTQNSTYASLILSLSLLGCQAGSGIELQPAGSDDVVATVDPEPSGTVRGRVVAPGADSVAANSLASGDALGEGTVDSEGKFAFSVSESVGPVVVTAFDARGSMLGSVLIDGGVGGDRYVVAAPIDAETSLEAAVAGVLSEGSSLGSSVDTVDLRNRIDARLAAAAADSAASVEVLGLAELAAGSAIDAAMLASGAPFGASARFDATLSARQQLDLALDAGVPLSDAQASYDAAVALAFASAGATAVQTAAADAAATLAFAASVDALTAGVASQSDVAEAARENGGSLSALLSAQAVAEALVQAGADSGIQARAEAAGEALVNAALSGDAATEAEGWSAWAGTLVGNGDVRGSILADAIEVDAISAVVADLMVDAVARSSDSLTADVATAADASLAAGTEHSAIVTGAAVWSAYAAFLASVEGEVNDCAPFFGSEVGGAAVLLVQASGSATAGGETP